MIIIRSTKMQSVEEVYALFIWGREWSFDVTQNSTLHLRINAVTIFEICPLLRHYLAYSANSLPTFRYNLSVPSSRVKKSKKIGCLKRRYGTTNLRCVITQTSADLVYIAAESWSHMSVCVWQRNELTTSYRGDTPTRLGCLRPRQRDVSANECDSGTNYLR